MFDEIEERCDVGRDHVRRIHAEFSNYGPAPGKPTIPAVLQKLLAIVGGRAENRELAQLRGPDRAGVPARLRGKRVDR